jgi:hypothetical protein
MSHLACGENLPNGPSRNSAGDRALASPPVPEKLAESAIGPEKLWESRPPDPEVWATPGPLTEPKDRPPWPARIQSTSAPVHD